MDEILRSRVLGRKWNNALVYYMKSAGKGRKDSPVIKLYDEADFFSFTAIMEKRIQQDIPFSSFEISVYRSSSTAIRNFGIKCGYAVSEFLFQIHPPGFYDKEVILTELKGFRLLQKKNRTPLFASCLHITLQQI